MTADERPRRNPHSRVDYQALEVQRLLAMTIEERLADPEAFALLLEIADEEGLT